MIESPSSNTHLRIKSINSSAPAPTYKHPFNPSFLPFTSDQDVLHGDPLPVTQFPSEFPGLWIGVDMSILKILQCCEDLRCGSIAVLIGVEFDYMFRSKANLLSDDFEWLDWFVRLQLEYVFSQYVLRFKRALRANPHGSFARSKGDATETEIASQIHLCRFYQLPNSTFQRS